jgi:uroporphyrinogen decarboxylase
METTRDRFNKVMHWQKPERVPDMDFGYWEETLEAWRGQGLPSHILTSEDLERHLGLEGIEIIPKVPVINGLHPVFEEEVLEDKEDRRIIRNEEGVLCEISKTSTSIPKYLKYTIESRDDWERLKSERLDPDRPDRIGSIEQAVEDAHSQGMPIRFKAGSLYGWLRNWMGVERISIALMTERAWVEEMMDHLTMLTLHLIEKALPDTKVDVAWWWEDMCYNQGPLLSPALFEALMVPRYKRITAALARCGIDLNVLDCDGCIYELVPGWLDSGINVMFPIEAAHTDPLALRKEHGRRALLLGGVDKVALIRGPGAIDQELARLKPLVDEGGFIPCVDHRVPPDVPLAHYLYYVEKKRELL